MVGVEFAVDKNIQNMLYFGSNRKIVTCESAVTSAYEKSKAVETRSRKAKGTVKCQPAATRLSNFYRELCLAYGFSFHRRNMGSIFILREEILSLAILFMLWFYAKGRRRSIRGASFQWIWNFAVMHVFFDGATVVSVNVMDSLPQWINLVLHYCFTTSAIWFCFEVCVYMSSLTFPISYVRQFKMKLVWVPLTYMMVAWAFPIEYVQGYGTNYASGLFVYFAIATALLLMVITVVIVIVHRKRIDCTIRRVFAPLILTLFLVALLQTHWTELLFTGATCTIITLGIFFGMESPVNVLQEMAYIDMNSGLKNRNCYIDESRALDHKYLEKHTAKIGVVYADLNHLKMVNDTYGHAAGDEMIRTAGMVLSKNFASAYNVYRMGGDEFLALYVNPEMRVINQEIERVEEELKAISATQEVPISVAIGYCESDHSTETIREVVEIADTNMYKNKKKRASA